MQRRVTSHVCVASTTMSLEAACDFSIPELLCMLNEKLYLECNRLQYHPLSAVSIPSLETEVSASGSSYLIDRGGAILNPYRIPPDQKSRNPGSRCSEVHSLIAEPVTTSKQVTTGDPVACRSTLPARRCRRGHEADCSIDPRMPVLAQLHHVRPRQLDANIEPRQGVDDVDP